MQKQAILQTKAFVLSESICSPGPLSESSPRKAQQHMDWQRSMWFAGNLNDEEAAEMVQNMQLAASEMDTVLVQLLSTWAERGRDGSPRSQVCYNY